MKIKTIKEIVTNPKKDEVVHFVGTVKTKKEKEYNKHKYLKLLIASSNFNVTATIDAKDVPNYDEVVKKVKINDVFYFEGKTDFKYGTDVEINISDVDEDVFFKRLEHEEESLEIKLWKHIWRHNEGSALALIARNKDINLSYEFYGKVPLFTVISMRMFRLTEIIVNDPKVDINIEDGFGETILESLIYMYGAENVSKEEKDYFEETIKLLINNDRYDLNKTDLNEDTAINIACEYPQMLWIVEALAAKENVDLNHVNDFNCAALGNAIRNKNIEAIKILAKRKDLIVRDADREMAKKYGVNLSEFGLV